MENSEIVQALRTGGVLREQALAKLLSDEKICDGIRDRLKKYRKSLELILPSSQRIFGRRRIDNATDYFMLEAVFRLDRSVREPEEGEGFLGSTYEQVVGYIVSTARFMCIDLLRKNGKQAPEEAIPEEVREYLEKRLLQQEKHRLLHGVLDRLGKGCKTLLLMFYAGYSYEEIAPQLGISTPAVAKTQKRRCYKKLLELVENSPLITELTN